MSASNHLSDQLKLFMTPQEIMGSVVDSVDRAPEYEDYDIENEKNVMVPAETMEDLWASKLSESKGKGSGPESLYDSIAKHGVQRHVTLEDHGNGTLYMGQGHHRVAAAADISEKTGRPMYIPVVYDSDFNYSNTKDYRDMYPQNVNPVGFDDRGH